MLRDGFAKCIETSECVEGPFKADKQGRKATWKITAAIVWPCAFTPLPQKPLPLLLHRALFGPALGQGR